MSGGDDLTENWENDTAHTSKKRKHESQATTQPAAAASTVKKHKPPKQRTAAPEQQPKVEPTLAASQRPLCFLSADEQASGFWQLYLQSKCGKTLTSIEQSAHRSTITLPCQA